MDQKKSDTFVRDKKIDDEWTKNTLEKRARRKSADKKLKED